MQWYTRLQDKLKALYDAYGKIAIWTYLVLWGGVLVAYAVAIHLGVRVEGAGEGASVVFGAWVAVKATQPVRIVVTLAATPLIARLLNRQPRSVPQE